MIKSNRGPKAIAYRRSLDADQGKWHPLQSLELWQYTHPAVPNCWLNGYKFEHVHAKTSTSGVAKSRITHGQVKKHQKGKKLECCSEDFVKSRRYTAQVVKKPTLIEPRITKQIHDQKNINEMPVWSFINLNCKCQCTRESTCVCVVCGVLRGGLGWSVVAWCCVMNLVSGVVRCALASRGTTIQTH